MFPPDPPQAVIHVFSLAWTCSLQVTTGIGRHCCGLRDGGTASGRLGFLADVFLLLSFHIGR